MANEQAPSAYEVDVTRSKVCSSLLGHLATVETSSEHSTDILSPLKVILANSCLFLTDTEQLSFVLVFLATLTNVIPIFRLFFQSPLTAEGNICLFSCLMLDLCSTASY